MTQNKRLMKILIWILGFFVVAGVIAQILFTQKVKDALENDLPENISLEYDALSTNVIFGKIALKGVELRTGTFDLESTRIQVSGLHYISLLRKGDIIISELLVVAPFFRLQDKEKDQKANPSKGASDQSILLEKCTIQNGRLEVFRETTDSLHVKIEDIDLMLTEVSFSKQTETQAMPMTFASYQLDTEKGYYDLGPLEYMQWDNLYLDSEKGYIKTFVLRSKYSKKELSRKLSVEHDHYDLVIDSLTLKQPDFGFDTARPKLHLAHLQVNEPKIDVYRDKLLPDDTRHKKLYNQTLRDLDFDLQIDSIEVAEGEVSYQERLEADVVPERLRFTDVSATILNLHSKGKGTVSVDINAQLMGDGPLSLNWSFDPMITTNEFLVTGSLSNFDSAKINPFLRTNMKAEVKGTINQMYFTFSGHELESVGDMKMNYDQFEFLVLKKDRLGVNKLLTTVVNLFTNNGKRTEDDGFRYGHYVVQRDTEKSFFNYLWLNVKEGLVETVAGNGKKK